MKKQRVIIWGFYPDDGVLKNTISYVWNSFSDAFLHLGYDVYWFPNVKVDNFDFSDCIFIAEGHDDSEIPLEKTSTYFVHCAWNPKKYIGNVARFIDIRHALKHTNQKNYIFELDKEKTKMDPGVYYEPSTNQVINLKNGYVDYMVDDFDKIYMSWATDLLPDQINENDVYHPRGDSIYFLGSLSSDGDFENISLLKEFGDECKKNGVKFKINNFYQNQISNEDHIKLYKESILGFDLRCKINIEWGYVPCRVFKTMSYGHLGLTNCPETLVELEGHVKYSPTPAGVFHEGMKHKGDYKFIKDGLHYIKDYHTYINRAKSLLKVL